MNGILIINKPKNCTSHDIVYKTKKILQEKVGHTGTLDPNATGVLPLLIGKATQISKYLIKHDKIYQAQIQLGEKRTTGDIEGEIIEQKEVNESNLKKENIESVLKNFKGKQKQIPPIYSAIKVNGKKLYEYARNGEQIELPKREVTIEQLKMIDWQDQKQELTFLTQVSKGTYIRSLVEDIATHLDTIGTMTALTRTKVGNFSLEQANTIAEIKNNQFKVYTIYEVLKSMYETRQIAGELEKKVLNGAKIDNPEDLDIVFFINEKKEPLALYRREGNLLKCYKMLKIGID